LEFEPQLTLLNYPKHVVDVTFFRGDDAIIIHDNNRLCVGINTQKLDYATHNLEFRTNPVSIEELPMELDRINNEFQELMLKIAKFAGPVGAFLPSHPCSKHINVSFEDMNFSTDWTLESKNGEYGIRYHARVPYDFIDYKILINKGYLHLTNHKWLDTPIFLGYSHTGEKWIEKEKLR